MRSINALSGGAIGIGVGNAFRVTSYTGQLTDQSIVTAQNMQSGSLLWLKTTSTTSNHLIHDTVRGKNNALFANSNSAESASGSSLVSFDSNGFTLVGNSGTNSNGVTSIAFSWLIKAGFLDVVTYTGNGSPRSIAHNLGSEPEMIIIKKRSSTAEWPVWHKDLDATEPEDYWISINSTNPRQLTSGLFDGGVTSSHFTVGDQSIVNQTGETFVAYLFAAMPGKSAFGSCIPSNSADVVINCGFKPRLILTKRSIGTFGTASLTGAWYLSYQNNADQTRWLRANITAAENSGGGSGMQGLVFNADGFTLPAPPVGDGYPANDTLIYAAWF